jgi:hypothetical protein
MIHYSTVFKYSHDEMDAAFIDAAIDLFDKLLVDGSLFSVDGSKQIILQECSNEEYFERSVNELPVATKFPGVYDPKAIALMRDGMLEWTMDYVGTYSNLQYLRGKTSKEQIAAMTEVERKVFRNQPPGLLESPVGAGKSDIMKQVIRRVLSYDLPIAIIVPDHKLADEYCAKSPMLFHHHGRTDPIKAQANPNLLKFVCHQVNNANEAAKHNHLPAHSLCSKCPNAMGHIMNTAKEDSDEYLDAKAFFTRKKMIPREYMEKPCHFLYEGLKEALASKAVVLATAAFSDAFGEFKVNNEGIQQRLVIVDEKVTLAKEIELTPGAIGEWRANIDWLLKNKEGFNGVPEHLVEKLSSIVAVNEPSMKADVAKVLDGKMSDFKAEDLILLLEIDIVFKRMIVAINDNNDIDKDEILRIHEKAKKGKVISRGSADWEEISFFYNAAAEVKEKFRIPLRALNALALNLQHGTNRHSRLSQFIYEVCPIINWAKERGSVIFLDATAPIAMLKFIQSEMTAGDPDSRGSYYRARAYQNMHVTRFNGNFYGRGNVRKQNYPAIAAKRFSEMESIALTLPRNAAIIAHKAWFAKGIEACEADNAADLGKAIFEEKTGIQIGWYGKDERGHNRWEGYRSLAIIGMPLLGEEGFFKNYSADRAAVIFFTGEVWPLFNGECDEPNWEGMVPGLPRQPEVLAWAIDLYAAAIIQGIGRARALNTAHEVVIQIYGGIQSSAMTAALEGHCVDIHVQARETIHRDLAAYRARGTNVMVINAALTTIKARGETVSVRSVRSQLRVDGKSAAAKAIEGRLSEMRILGQLPLSTKGGRPRRW